MIRNTHNKGLSAVLLIFVVLVVAAIGGYFTYRSLHPVAEKTSNETPAKKVTPPKKQSITQTEKEQLPSKTEETILTTKKIGVCNDKCHYLFFSLDGEHSLYVASEGKKQFVVFDGKEGKRYDSVDEFDMTPDGKHFAYVAMEGKPEQGGKSFVVLDGKEERKYHLSYYPLFSLDGKHFAYVAMDASPWQGGKSFVVLDGKESKKYNSVEGLVFSPDSKHFAYIAKEGKKQFVVFDGKEGKKYDFVVNPTFSHNSKHFAYVVRDGGKSFVVLDGKEGKKYGDVNSNYGSFVFSPDDKHYAYIASYGEFWLEDSFVVLDGKEGKKYDSVVDGPTFSHDSKHLAYAAKEDVPDLPFGKNFIVLDGKEKKKYGYAFDPVFSPDDKHFAYIAGNYLKGSTREKFEREEFVVLDDKEGKTYNAVFGGMKFSPDSKSLSYVVSNKQDLYAVLKRVGGKEYSWNARDGIVFSPDGKHFACAAREGDKTSIILDGKKKGGYDLLGDLVFTKDGQYLYFGAKKGNEVWRIVKKVGE